MKRIYVRDLKPGQQVRESFLIGRLVERIGRRGDVYLVLTLVDRTGQVRAYADCPAEPLLDGDVAHVSGRTRAAQGELEIIVNVIQPVDPLSYNLVDFIPAAPESPDAYLNRLSDIVAEVETAAYRNLIFAFLDDCSFLEPFSHAPASTSYHHAHDAGLLQHTVEVMESVLQIPARLRGLDRDLLLTAAFLHDIGKIDAYTQTYPYRLTPAGHSIGHEILGLHRVFSTFDRRRDIPLSALGPLLALLVRLARARSATCQVTKEMVALTALDGLSAGCSRADRMEPLFMAGPIGPTAQ